MKQTVSLLLVIIAFSIALPVFAEQPVDMVTIVFTITDNPANAISARIGIDFDENVFEFVSAQNISRDILNSPPTSTKEMFGLLNMNGISAGELCRITLRIRSDAPDGTHAVSPVVDSVYNIRREVVSLVVKGSAISIGHGELFHHIHRFHRKAY